MSLAHRTSDGLTSTWSVLDHLYNVPKQLLPNMRRIKEMTFKNVPELLKRNISLNNIKNSQSFYFIFKSVILQKVLLVSAVNRCQISVAGQKCPSARHSSLHSGDLSYCIAVAAHRADLCYSVVDLGHSGALTSCNGLVKVRRLMLCRGDCISASPRGAVDLRQLESDLHHSAPPYHPLQLNKAPLQYPHFFPGVMRGI